MAKKYFKHYEGASTSEFVQKVIKEHGLIGYAHWFLLLELMVSKYDGKSILIRLTVQEVATKLKIKPARSHSVIGQFSSLSNNQVITKIESTNNQDNFDGFIIIISAPILSDLQAKDFGRERPKRAHSAPRYKIEDNKIEDNIDSAHPTVSLNPEKTKVEITPDRVIELFNSKLSGVGKIKTSPGFFLPAPILEDFKIITGFKEFQKLGTWENYFNLVSQSEFLTMKLTPTIAWLMKSENAFKVLGGQYQNQEKEITPKHQTSGQRHKAESIANGIFDEIIKCGSHGLMERLKQFDEIETRALDLFGRASEILQCNDFQSGDVKKRLKSACEQAIQEQVVAS